MTTGTSQAGATGPGTQLQPVWGPCGDRYSSMTYRRCGRSGLMLPAISVGLWQNFGGSRPLEVSRSILRRAFDLGVTHFDLANNYGPPSGTAEETLGRLMTTDFRALRDELVISTKAGYEMWPGPYGNWGSRKYLLASLDQSLRRMNLDYVDIFYSHRVDAATPLEETLGALATAVHQGKALYAGISNYPAPATREAAATLRNLGAPLLVHQPSYSLLNRSAEPELLGALGEEGIGCTAFSPLSQGILTEKYLAGIPEGSRASQNGPFLRPEMLSADNLARVKGLAAIAASRGQQLAQMALSWVLRDPRVTTAVIGVSSTSQLEANLGALANLEFSDQELAEIDKYAASPGSNVVQRTGPVARP